MIKNNSFVFDMEHVMSILDKEDNGYIIFSDLPILGRLLRLRKHDSLVIAGDTGSGKSGLALNIVDDLSKQYPVLYFNLEMSTFPILKRLVGIHSGIRTSLLEDSKDALVRDVFASCAHCYSKRPPLRIFNDVYEVEDIADLIKEYSQEQHTIVIIDHMLLLRTRKSSHSRYERFTDISECLRQIARKENTTMILLCQQNRSGKMRNSAPDLDSLKETGSIENDATHVVFIWQNKNGDSFLTIRKNRDGENNKTISLIYDKKDQKIREVQELCMG